jgi:putative DNA primase/helicase
MAFPSDLRAIARALGGEVVGRQVVAPGPGHSPRDRSLSVTISAAAPEGFLAFSHAGDDFAECRDHVKARLGIDRRQQENRPQTPPRRPTQPPRDDDRDARALMFAKQIAFELRPILGSPGETYLRDARKIVTSAIVDVLERTDGVGWHPAVYFNEPGHALHGRKLGAIISLMTDMITAEPTGAISRTYIHEGRKLGKAKTLGSPAGIIRLSEDADVLEGLLIAEGLETALAGMAIGLRPMWATGSTALMTKFPVLPGIEALTIIADHDANGAGERAAGEVASRWREAGKETRIIVREGIGDINDALAEGGPR